MPDKQEYDWIDDPFKENAPQQNDQGMKTGSKVFIGCGCLIVVIGIIVLFVLFFSSLSSLLTN